MKLKQLLQKNDELSALDNSQGNLGNLKGVLVANWGDGFLLKNNFIYSRIRELTLKNNFTYVSKLDQSFSALPLARLDFYLDQKKIPYVDNVSAIQQVEAQNPNQIEWDHIVDNLYKNHVFHESCHAVARSCLRPVVQDLLKLVDYSLFNQKDDLFQIKVSLILLEESFANACEFLAVADVEDSMHRIFFESNSYICMFDDRVNLKKAMSDFNRKSFFVFIWLSYYHSNFLFDQWNDQDFKKCLSIAFGPHFQPTPQHAKTLRALSKNAFALNPRFRHVTTDFYFKMLGFRGNLKQALEFDHWDVLSLDLQKSILDPLPAALLESPIS